MNNLSWRLVSEIIAASSIVISLVFVGLELRENSAVARAEAYSSTAENAAASMQQLALDKELSELMLRAFSGELPSSFEGIDRFRISIFFQSLLQIHQAQFRAAQSGLIPMAEFESLPAAGGGFNNNYFRQTWHSNFKHTLPDDYVEFAEALPWNQET